HLNLHAFPTRRSSDLEQLIDQVLFNPDGARQEMRDEHLGKGRLLMENADDGPFLQPHDLAFGHCCGCGRAPRLSCQASLSAEFIDRKSTRLNSSHVAI